jgi:hypothetical protein
MEHRDALGGFGHQVHHTGVCATRLPCDIDEVLVVGEKQDLRFSAQLEE